MDKSPAKLNMSVQIIVIIVLVVFCGILFVLNNGEKTRRKQVETKLVETLKAKEETQKNLNDLKTAKDAMETKITGLEADIKKLNDSLVKEKGEKTVLKTDLDAKTSMINDLNEQLDRERSDKNAINDRLTKTQRDLDGLKAQIDQLTKIKMDLEAKVKELSEMPSPQALDKEGGVELEKIVVSADSKVKGEVVVVNTNLGFVVVNLGSKNNITAGTILGIYRNESFIGEVQVDKVYEGISSANILPEWKNVAFKEGDKAIIME